MKLAYRAIMLLTVDDPSEATMTFLSKKSYSIAKQILGNQPLTHSLTHSYSLTLTQMYSTKIQRHRFIMLTVSSVRCCGISLQMCTLQCAQTIKSRKMLNPY